MRSASPLPPDGSWLTLQPRHLGKFLASGKLRDLLPRSSESASRGKYQRALDKRLRPPIFQEKPLRNLRLGLEGSAGPHVVFERVVFLPERPG